MKRLLWSKVFILSFLLILSSHADGTTTNTWTQSTESEFGKGTSQNVSILSKGEIQLSPKAEIIKGIKSAFVWSIAADQQNQVFVGAGDPGTIYLVKNGSLEAVEFFKSPELYVQSLTTDKQGNLYAGTAPRGIIYKVNNKGEATTFCSLPVPYIWGLAVDGDSNLFAATGNEGILFKISPDGIPSIFFDSPETNLLAIIVDQNNNIYVGTEPNGLVYKISSSGHAQVLYDASEDEIHCLAMNSGNIYAGTASGAQPQVPAASAAQPLAQTGIVTSIFREEKGWDLNLPEELPMAQPVSIQQQKPAVKGVDALPKSTSIPIATNYIYKITPEGLTQKIFEAGQAFILGMSADARNNLYVVTGNKPGVYKIGNDETSSSLVNVEEVQALCCLNTTNNELYFGTGNSGKVYKLSPTFVKEGNFLSSVLDTTMLSRWGCIYWTCAQPEGTKVALATRSGNCEKPDTTWSGWSIPYTSSGEKIISPPARFIQYNAALRTTSDDKTPALDAVSVAYLPQNQPPKIINFAVEKEASAASQKPSETKTNGKVEMKLQAASGQKSHHQIAQKTIQWEVEDPNNDTLQLTIYYKGVDEKAWKVIDTNAQKKGTYTWDTLRLPDGKYQIKLVASDSPDNPPETALSTDKIIQPIVIDNSRPIIKPLSIAAGTNERYVISGTAKDDYSNIVKVQYTIDGQEWISAYPVDGVFDSQEESFQITTKPLAPGDYTLIVNAFDSEGNIGIERVMVEAK